MELKKNDRVIHGKRLGTVMSDMGTYDVIGKETWIDVLLDGDEHICQIRKDSLKKIEDNAESRFGGLNNRHCTYVNYPFMNTEIDIKELTKEIKKGLGEMQNNIEWGHKGNKPIQLNRKDIDNKCYEVMGEKTLYICLEELAELQQAITKFLRGKPNMENIEEEIADVEICLEWVKDIIKPNGNHVEAWKDYKYNRMKSRIEKGEMK